MAFKLSKRQVAERDALATELRAKADALTTAIAAYNEAIATVSQTVTDAIDEYNATVEIAREFVGGIAEMARDEWSSKSHKWQEGEKGTEADAWVEAWKGAILEDVEVDVGERLEEIDPSEIAVTLEDLPEGP
jgi:hypothetical protein